jgi:hypothetical protein
MLKSSCYDSSRHESQRAISNASNSRQLEQKLDYLHNNPVEAGMVSEPHHWKYSSAGDYSEMKGDVEIELLR